MKPFVDPIVVLRKFFANLQSPQPTGAPRPACECGFWNRKDGEVEEVDVAPMAAKPGQFGVRDQEKPCRIRFDIGLNWPGRPPGGHTAPVMRRMPPPHPVQAMRTKLWLNEIDRLVAATRVPKGFDPEQWREELTSRVRIRWIEVIRSLRYEHLFGDGVSYKDLAAIVNTEKVKLFQDRDNFHEDLSALGLHI